MYGFTGIDYINIAMIIVGTLVEMDFLMCTHFNEVMHGMDSQVLMYVIFCRYYLFVFYSLSYVGDLCICMA